MSVDLFGRLSHRNLNDCLYENGIVIVQKNYNYKNMQIKLIKIIALTARSSLSASESQVFVIHFAIKFLVRRAD